MKKILVTGVHSYIGQAFHTFMDQWPQDYQIDAISMVDGSWRERSFAGYDSVFHVAGIAHADVAQVTEEQIAEYYRVNRDMAVEAAKKAKADGAKQFIFMSSMIIYSGCKEKVITRDTAPKPLNFYGDSKWQADYQIRCLADDSFKVVTLRPPMIYGKNSKGNYPELAKLASRLPAFPVVKNQRSMLYVENLSMFVKLMIDYEESGIFFPQNAEYVNTSDMVRRIAKVRGHKIWMVPYMSGPVKLLQKFPGKIGRLATKAFDDSVYDLAMSEYPVDYRVCDLEESIRRTEG